MSPGAFYGLFLGFFLVLAFLVLLGIYGLAKLGVFFTFCRGGEIVAVMVGEEPWKFIMSHWGYHLNDPDDPRVFDKRFPKWEVLPDKWGHPDKRGEDGKWVESKKASENTVDRMITEPEIKNWFERTFGIYWVGVFPFKQIYIRKFAWTEIEETEGGLRSPRTRNELVSSIFAKDFPYLVKLEAAETARGIPVNLFYTLTIRTTNPLKALFGTDDWYEQVTAVSNRTARNYIGKNQYEDLTSELKKKGESSAPTGTEKELFSTPLIALTKQVPGNKDGLSRLYGITIVNADLFSVVLADEKDKEATVRVFQAEQQAEAAVIIAEGDKKATIERGAGDAKALEAVAEVMSRNPQAARLRELQALEKSQLRVIGNNLVVPTVGTGD